MGFSDTRRVWERLRELPFECPADGLREVIVEEAEHLFLPSDGPVPFAGDATDDVLVFIGSDADGILGLVRVPADRLVAGLRDDLCLLHGRLFANSADLTEPMWDAAVRVMAALAMEMGDVAELARWAQDEGSALDVAALTPIWDLWHGCDVRQWEQLASRPRAICAFCRAM